MKRIGEALLERVGLSEPLTNPTCAACGTELTYAELDRWGVDNKLLCFPCRDRNRETLERERHEAEVARRAANIEAELSRACGVPKRYLGCSRDTWDGRYPAQLAAWDGEPDMVLLLGPTGTGKTHLAIAVLRDWVLRGKDGLYLSMVPAMTAIKQDLERGRDLLADWGARPLLIIDDFGREQLTDFSQDMVRFLVETRFNACLPTIVTSNLSDTDLSQRDSPLASRLASGLVLKTTGRDRRVHGGDYE